MRRILVLRHGRTEWNASGRFQGQLDPPLDELGVSQAKAAARHLAHLRPCEILTSDLQRASRTADALAEVCGMVAVRDPRLRELHLGAWQGLTRAEVQERFPEDYQEWLSGGADGRPAGPDGVPGETYIEVGLRTEALVAEVTSRMGDEDLAVFVTHGGTARALFGQMLELSYDSWWRLAPLSNCAWSLLIETEKGWRLAEHGVGVQEVAEMASSPDIEPGDADKGMSGF